MRHSVLSLAPEAKQSDTPLILNDLFDAYLKDRENPFAEKRCMHPKHRRSDLVPFRALWGAMLFDDFCVGSKARVKSQAQAWRESGLSQGTVRKRISTFKTVFNFAMAEEITTRIPVFSLPANGPPRERFVDPKTELAALLRAADSKDTPSHIKLNNELLMRTGQRAGAILALRWSKHIDLENRVILFRETEAPENRSKKRRTNQPMNDELHNLLLEARTNADSDWVIEWRGKPVKSTYAGMKALYKRAGIDDLHQHDLRRTAATYVSREMGGNLGAAAGFIGDTETIAAKHYVQDHHETRLPQVTALSDVLKRARARP